MRVGSTVSELREVRSVVAKSLVGIVCKTLSEGPQLVDRCLSKQSVTFRARQPAKLTRTAEFGQ